MFNRFKSKIIFIKKLSSLGANIFSKIYIVLIILFISLRDRFKLPVKNFIFNLKINKVNFKLCFFGHHYELLMMEEIFCNHEYDLNIKDVKNILDLGANIGLSSILFSIKFPDSKIWAFEPDPETFSILSKNINQFQNIKIFNLAVSDLNTPISFFKNKKHNASSFIKREEGDQEIKINSITLNDFIDSYNLDKIDILKFDIEGGEFKVFRDFDNWENVLSIVGEIHNDLNTEVGFDLLSLFKNNFNLSIENGGKNGRFIVKGTKKV